MKTSTSRSLLACSLAGLALLGCGGGGTHQPEPLTTFTVASGAAQAIGSVPWPSDLFLDSTGHVSVPALPVNAGMNTQFLLDDLSKVQDGFGVTTGAFFPIGDYAVTGGSAADANAGMVDASTLTGNVHLYPLACKNGFMLDTTELPVYTYLRADDVPQQIYAAPAPGTVLHEACTYAYVVTNGVTTDKGALHPSDDLTALLGAKKPGSRLVSAWNVFAPLRARLATGSVTTAMVADATVFTTHSVSPDYLAARQTLLGMAAPTAKVTHVFASTATSADDASLDVLFGTPAMEQPGVDNPGGLAHANIDYVVQGTFDTIDYLGGSMKDTLGINETVVGLVAYDASGKPMVKDTITVPYTIVIPKCGTGLPCTTLANLPFAVIQHGLGVQRGWMMSEANVLAGKGIASVLIDLPFHGQRAIGAKDAVYQYTGAAGADGWADITSNSSDQYAFGFFAVNGNDAASIPPLVPACIRGAFFQAVVDIMQAFRLMAAGDLSALSAKEPRLAGLTIDDTRELYVGESFGSMIGTIVSAFEPKLVAAVLDVDGGGLLFPLLINSPTFAPVFIPLLNTSLGETPSKSDPVYTDWGYNLAEMLLEGGDSLAFAPYVVAAQSWPGSTETDSPAHILQASAFEDELVPNPANLALAQALGLEPLTLSDGSPPSLTAVNVTWDATPATGMLSANAGGQTAVFIQFAQASHGMMSERDGEHTVSFMDADQMMWPPLDPPVMFTNPTDRLNQIMGDFIATALTGAAPTVQ